MKMLFFNGLQERQRKIQKPVNDDNKENVLYEETYKNSGW